MNEFLLNSHAPKLPDIDYLVVSGRDSRDATTYEGAELIHIL